MKKIFVSLSLMLVVGLTTVLANDETVSDKVKESFKKEFVGATSVKWEKQKDFQTATFVFYDHLVIAYFNADGELLASARNVLFYELPMAVVKSLDKKFPWINPTEMTEVSNTEGTFYKLTIERQKKRYNIKADASGNILRIVKIKDSRQLITEKL